MPRTSQHRTASAKATGSGVGKAHLEVQTWRAGMLAPACAKRGRHMDDFLLVPGDPGKLKCPVCAKDVAAKNENDKHRHELSLGHRRACAQELQLRYEELGADKLALPIELANWVCGGCNTICVRYDVLFRHQDRTGHRGNIGTGITDARRSRKTTKDPTCDSPTSSTPSLPSTPSASTQPLTSGTTTPVSYPASPARLSLPAADFGSSPMSRASSFGPTPLLTDYASSSDDSVPPTPTSYTTAHSDRDILSALLQPLAAPGLEPTPTQMPMLEPVFSPDADFPSSSYLCSQESPFVSGSVAPSIWDGLAFPAGIIANSYAQNLNGPGALNISECTAVGHAVGHLPGGSLSSGNWNFDGCNLDGLDLDAFSLDDLTLDDIKHLEEHKSDELNFCEFP